MGRGYVWFAPKGTDTVTADQTTVESAYDTYLAS